MFPPPAVTPLEWLLLTAGVIVVNTIPALMPPTWSLLAFAHLQGGTSVWLLATIGASGVMISRAILALVRRTFGQRIVPRAWQHNIEAPAPTIRSRRTLSPSTLGLFALDPIPSNHLFIAADIARLPLPPLLAVFGLMRFVSYVVWVSAADAAVSSLGDAIRPSLGSGVALATQILGFVMLAFGDAGRLDPCPRAAYIASDARPSRPTRHAWQTMGLPRSRVHTRSLTASEGKEDPDVKVAPRSAVAAPSTFRCVLPRATP